MPFSAPPPPHISPPPPHVVAPHFSEPTPHISPPVIHEEPVHFSSPTPPITSPANPAYWVIFGHHTTQPSAGHAVSSDDDFGLTAFCVGSVIATAVIMFLVVRAK